MPVLTLITKFGIGAAMLSCYQASYSDQNIFPSQKRASAIGICNIIARSITTLAPIINELAPPFPMLTFVALVSLGIITSFSFVTPS